MARRGHGRVPDERERERLIRRAADGLDAIDKMSAKEVGKLGEALALSYLEARGYTTVCQGYRCPEGEADLIVIDHESEEIVLVEVKTRRDRRKTGQLYPELAVDERKRRRYGRIAARYIMENFPVFAVRFDIIAITLESGGTASIEHLMSMFSWDSDR